MRIACVGCGNMGEAILAGLRAKGGKTHQVVVAELRPERRSFLKKKYKVDAVEMPAEAVLNVDVVVLAVKPQDLVSVLKTLKPGPLFVSIAAGATTKLIEKTIGGKARVVRVMPNLPAMISEGISALSAGRHASAKDLDTAVTIMSSVGETLVLKEKMIDAVTAVSGSGPAYVFMFVECMMKAARKLGFDEKSARLLVYRTLLGSAHMLAASEDTPETLRQKVTSKGGTTQAATDVFLSRDIFDVYASALKAARNRARELSA